MALHPFHVVLDSPHVLGELGSKGRDGALDAAPEDARSAVNGSARVAEDAVKEAAASRLVPLLLVHALVLVLAAAVLLALASFFLLLSVKAVRVRAKAVEGWRFRDPREAEDVTDLGS